MRPLTHWVCLALGAAVVITVARAQPTDNSLQIYVVRMLSGPEQNPGGAGIYIGNGLVITAAHVAGPSVRGVRIKGLNVPAKPVKVGTFPQLDLALISMDKETLPISLRLRRMPLCQRQAPIGASVIVAAPQAITRSRIMSPMLLPPDYQVKFPTLISDVDTGGKSGSGVFDAEKKCLLGILSLKITNNLVHKDIATYFVPASTIRSFVPAGTRW